MTQQWSRGIMKQIIIVIICAVLMILAGPVQNKAFSQIIQVTDTTGIQGNFFPSINADGTRVAFMSDKDHTGGNGDLNFEIFIYDATTMSFTQVTNTTGGPILNYNPSINADGTRVAFSSESDFTGGNPDGNQEIFIYDTTTMSFTQVTYTTVGDNQAPSINADGTRVAFMSENDLTGGNPDNNLEIFIASTGFIQVTNTDNGMNLSPSISADGTRVAFQSNSDDTNYEIFVFDTATMSSTQVTNTAGGTNFGPSINADGTRIAFSSGNNFTGGNADGNQEIFIYDTTTTSFTQVTYTTVGDNQTPSINADGTRVAFSSESDLTGGNADGNLEIFVFDTTTGFSQVTDTTGGTEANMGASINADGTRVAFYSNRDITGGNSDGNHEIFMTSGPITADSILFPWIVQSDDVTTVISVINTAQTWAESVGLPLHDNRIHIEYWHKLSTANDQEEQCREYNFEVTSSKDDMVTWDMAGHFNSGLPMFNDTSNEVIGVPDMTLAVENPRRAFLIVDNATDALNDAGTNVDGTMYGEATIIEHKTGAAWGYIAYNAVGGPENFSDADYRDQSGEVIGRYETTQTTLLNPNDAITKLFVTPTGMNQRMGNLNARVQLCRFPEINPGPDGRGGRIDSDPYKGDCESGGIWNNEEGGFSFTVEKDIVCTTADNIVEFFGGAGTSAYTQWVASGKAGWTYLVTQSGNIDNRDGREAHEEADEAIIGKLEFGTGLSWDGSIADTINTFVWLRDEANYAEHCSDNLADWRCKPGGVSIIHNEFYEDFEQLPN